jgi:hypothetical protein
MSRWSAAPSRSDRLSVMSPRVTNDGGVVRIYRSCHLRCARGGDAHRACVRLTRHRAFCQIDNAVRIPCQSLHCVMGMRRACPCVVVLRAIRRYTTCAGSVLSRGAVRRDACVRLELRDAALWLYVYILFAWHGTGRSGITSASHLGGLVFASKCVHVVALSPFSHAVPPVRQPRPSTRRLGHGNASWCTVRPLGATVVLTSRAWHISGR